MKLSKPKPRCVHYVWFNNTHVNSLVATLSRFGFESIKSSPKLQSAFLLILFSPIYPFWYRISGLRIIHIHWVAGQFARTRFKSKFARRFFYIWFRFFLLSVRVSGLKLVWTSHNFLPHEPIFLDDRKARQNLVSACDAIICFDQKSKVKLIETFSAQNLTIIPPAEPVVLSNQSVADTRAELGIQSDSLHFLALGHVREYKGPDLFLEAAIEAQISGHATVAGSPGEPELMAKLSLLSDELEKHEIANSLKFSFLSESEFGNLMFSADFLVCPFRRISNSGIVNNAMELGIPLILPDLASLNWVPRASALWYDPNNEVAGLASALKIAETLSSQEIDLMKGSSKNYMKDRSWDNYVTKYIEVYQGLL
ncbi:MAG: glycosyltransferase family 4 protein [Actinobacteria bacterium]|nr:glycosyltransferase family 4 protein [Actinomycetota bacterium]